MKTGRSFKALASGIFAMKPSAVCIGAQKAGTTAFYEYLKLHPQVLMPRVKELDFFNCDSRYESGFDRYLGNFPRKGLRTVGKITLDITPGYLGGAERAAPRIASFRPSMRIIVLLRNPVTRAFSAWQMYRRFCRSNRQWFLDWIGQCNQSQTEGYFQSRSPRFGDSFAQDVNEEIIALRSERPIEMPILALGDYARLLGHYFEQFSRQQILVLWSERFRDDTVGTLQEIEKFLDLTSHKWSSEQLVPHFKGEYENDVLPAEIHELLHDYYAPRNEALVQMVGGRTNWS